MEKIFTVRIRSLLFFSISLLPITCFGQETSFLNRFHFPVKDTLAHKPCFYQDMFTYPDSTIIKVYTLDKLLLKEEVHLLDIEKKEIFRIILEYDSLGNVVGRREKDSRTNTEYSMGFYPDGQLKTRYHYFNQIQISEEYFDVKGKSVNKPEYSDEELPSPKGGLKGWNLYLANNMVYPNVAKRKKQEGLVYVWFMVDAEGNIKDPEIMNPEQVSPLLAEEALRVIKKYPHRWSPGKKEGVSIAVSMKIPIHFKV